jgi:hypothetical protein
MDKSQPFRERALAFFKEHLGEPTAIPAEPGFMYRWVLHRKLRPTLNVYITLDSPELLDLAHVMIGDPAVSGEDAIQSFVMRKEEDFHPVLARIRKRLDAS